MPTQSAFDLGEPRQNSLTFPVSLVEKYQPKIENFIGLSAAKRVVGAILKKPRPWNLLFVGPPGTGKTTMGMALAEQLPAALHHHRAQSCDVATLQDTWERCQYMPAKGKFHLVLIDEADGMTEKAQLQWLSYGDSAASLRPMWGGGFERGEAPPVIWVPTCNGIGPKHTTPPLVFEKRFLSRFLIVPFEAPSPDIVGPYLQAIWEREKGPKGMPPAYFRKIAKGIGVRDALNRLDVELLARLARSKRSKKNWRAKSRKRNARLRSYMHS